MRNRGGQFVVATATVLATVAVWTTAAAAHAEFPGAGSYPSGSNQRLVLEVPEERDETTLNVGVKLQLPADWSATGCEAAAPWTCGVSSSGGHPVVEWTRDASAPSGSSDETFAFSVHIGAPGQVAIPVNQTYSTGEVVHWTGPQGSSEPAPVLEIVAAVPTSSSTTIAPPASTTSSSSTPSPNTTRATAPTGSVASTIAGVSTTTSATTVNRSTSTMGATTTSSKSTKSTAAPTTTVTDDTALLASVDESDDSGGTPAWAIALPAVAVVAAGGIGYRVRSSRRLK